MPNRASNVQNLPYRTSKSAQSLLESISGRGIKSFPYRIEDEQDDSPVRDRDKKWMSLTDVQQSTLGNAGRHRLKRPAKDNFHDGRPHDGFAVTSIRKRLKTQISARMTIHKSTPLVPMANNLSEFSLSGNEGDGNSPPRRSAPTETMSLPDVSVIELSDDSASDDEIQFVRQQRSPKKPKIKAVPRVLEPSENFRNRVEYNGIKLMEGCCVEFCDGTFMKVKAIYTTRTEGTILVGQVFLRTTAIGVKEPKQRHALTWTVNGQSSQLDTRIPSHYRGHTLLNEVVQKISKVDGEHPNDYGLWRRSIRDVRRPRELQITNLPYSEANCLTEGHVRGQREVMKLCETAPLTCRWKDITVCDEAGKWKEQNLEKPSLKEVDANLKADAELLQTKWRGLTTLIDLDKKPITFADGFCGAGGVSSGARQAGMTVVVAFDIDEKKISTYEANNPSCKSFTMGVDEFIERMRKKKRRIDVLHLSPPCQPFSAANTNPNQEKNERNQTPLLAVADVINAVKPCIVTIEEAPGIVERHHQWFFALLQQFTNLNFTLRWAKLKAAEFGVPQLRKRFVLIAAAPGEILPPFPAPTHELGEVTIATTLAQLQREHHFRPVSDHNTERKFDVKKLPYDPDTLAKTITCNGGESYHPDGSRSFTPRELAMLQTFSARYKFGKNRDGGPLSVTELRTQIGNAVPPLLAKAVMSEIVNSLRSNDKERSVRRRTKSRRQNLGTLAAGGGELVEISDSE